MARISNREKILTAGMEVVHRNGFANASVRDIVHAAGVPQGSFTNHFQSKEAFGLELIDIYFGGSCDVIRATLLNDEKLPLERLAEFVDVSRDALDRSGMRNGCMLGNFTAEAANNDHIRSKLLGIYREIEDAVAYCLNAAKTRGDVPADMDVPDVAALIVQSQQGANLLAKAYGDTSPIERFKKTLFEKILK